MAKKIVIASVAAGTTSLLFVNRSLRDKASKTFHTVYTKLTSKNKNKEQTLETKIGHSHPYDYEDQKMVGEGALTSIQHYNKQQQNK